MKPTQKAIIRKLLDSGGGMSESGAAKLADKILNCTQKLAPNISEWLESKPFSDIWINNKYCLNAVLKIRGNPKSDCDIADAILALDAYAADINNEHMIWQNRM